MLAVLARKKLRDFGGGPRWRESVQGREILSTARLPLAKSRPIICSVLYCHKGDRSLDLAAYFHGHDMRNTKSLAGGIDAWSCLVDESVPRYKLEMD